MPADVAPRVIEELERFLAFVDDPSRTVPIVLISPKGGSVPPYGVSPRKVAVEVGTEATVWTIPEARDCYRLEELRPDISTYGGAIRVIGTGPWSDVIRTDRPQPEIFERLRRSVAKASRAREPQQGRTSGANAAPKPATPPRPGPVNRDDRRPAPPRRSAPKPGHLAGRRGSRESELREAAAQAANRYEQEIAALRAERDAVAAERDAVAAECAALSADLAGARQRIHELEVINRDLREELHSPVPVVFQDAERQLRYEIEQWWLQHLSEQDRQKWPLRSYTVGPHFLDCLSSTEIVTHSRVLAVLVDVVTRRVFNVHARRTRPHHFEHHRGSAAVRADGAAAYRAFVKQQSPGGARVVWWERVDNSVELEQLGHHDRVLRGVS